MTKNQLKAKYTEYLATPSRCVDDVYARPSTAKRRAELNIINYLVDQNGYGYRVMSHNSQMFTVGYIIQNDEGKLFVYETAKHRYYLPLDDLKIALMSL